MDVSLKNKAEQNALNACGLKTFQGFDLRNAKKVLAEMLSAIGTNGMFSEYTKHDITHVDGMLNLLDFIIPSKVQDVMSPADWMLIVLACYFHDLGMIITNEEYDNRHKNKDFQKYQTKINIAEYEVLSPELKDKTLFQDFVRSTHGKRVEDLLVSVAKDEISGNPIQKLLKQILGNIDADFLKDLGVICRSHEDDFNNYKDLDVKKPYEQSSESNVNLLYVAAILRTADLMHVTSERTPNVAFTIINPQNPYSRREWVKQRSVKQVRPLEELDKDGKVDKTIQPHFLDVQGNFTDEDAYSHFMDYLNMAEQQLKITYGICKESSDRNDNGYIFPWDGIYKNNIKTEGFNAEKLKFELDQENILKLLTGHTLYNQSNVALRELSQNAIDACRLFNQNTKNGSTKYTPKVVVEWNSEKRVLKVSDNGTGMDEDIIKKYLLKVGASRYQSDEFKKKHRFHSISRFGIGLLTCFMISDDFEVITLWYEEDKAHRLKIKNLQGRYMLRNDVDPDDILDYEHGTTFILRVHDDVDFSDIVDDLKRWIIVPECDFKVIVDGVDCQIGYLSIESALKEYLENNKILVDDKQFKLVSESDASLGVNLYFLLHKHSLYNNWVLYNPSSDLLNDDNAPIGICIEGIKVTNSTPGFTSRNYIAVVNCKGEHSPKTNVARDGIEQSSEQKALLEFIYKSYLNIIGRQFDGLDNQYSLSWKLKEVQFYIDRVARNSNYQDKESFDECLHSFDCNLVDSGSEYSKKSIRDFGDEIWTIESNAYAAAEKLLQEINGCSETALTLFKRIDPTFNQMDRKVYSNMEYSKYATDIFLCKYEVDEIAVYNESRRIELQWKKQQNRWLRVFGSTDYRRYSSRYFYFPEQPASIKMTNVEDYDIIVSKYGMFCISDHPLFSFIVGLLHSNNIDSINRVSVIIGYILYLKSERRPHSDNDFRNYFNSNDNFLGDEMWNGLDKTKLQEYLQKPIRILDFTVYYSHKNEY